MKKKPASDNKAHLSNLLAVYRNRLRPPQASIEKEVIKAVESVVGFTLNPDQVSYTVSSKTIYLKVPSILKTEIKSNLTEIQKQLAENLPDKDAPRLFL